MRLNVYRCGLLCLFAAVCLLAAAAAVAPATVADLRASFAKPPDDARMMVRWWWYGPSVTKPELERELRSMKEGGIGGFEVQPTYPLALDDPRHRDQRALRADLVEPRRQAARGQTHGDIERRLRYFDTG